MKLEGLSLIVPVLDLRMVGDKVSRIRFLSPDQARTEEERRRVVTYLKSFGCAKRRKFAVPGRLFETISFSCRQNLSLPSRLPDGSPVVKTVRRVYLDEGVTVRFDLSLFSNPMKTAPLSRGAHDDWVREFWDTPVLAARHAGRQPLLFPAALEELVKSFATASNTKEEEPDATQTKVPFQDCVIGLPPLVITVAQFAGTKAPMDLQALDGRGDLWVKPRVLRLPRTPADVSTLLIAYPQGRFQRMGDPTSDPLRDARLLAAWLHTDTEILRSLIRRQKSSTAEATALTPHVEKVRRNLDRVLASSPFRVEALGSRYQNALAILAEELEEPGSRGQVR